MTKPTKQVSNYRANEIIREVLSDIHPSYRGRYNRLSEKERAGFCAVVMKHANKHQMSIHDAAKHFFFAIATNTLDDGVPSNLCISFEEDTDTLTIPTPIEFQIADEPTLRLPIHETNQ